MRKHILFTAITLACAVSLSAQTRVLAPESPYGFEPLEMFEFPAKDFPITKYGAKPADVKANTLAFQKAMAACNKAGGGRVVVPAGDWHTGPIHFLSNVNLYLSEGARLVFEDDPQLYLPAVNTTWEGAECMNYSPLIYAYECRNVGISGPGVVKKALEQVKGAPFDVVAETIKKTAFKVTRMGQLVAQEAAKRLNVPFGIVDLSLAPTPAVGDSVSDILEAMGLERTGAPGTTAALAILNDQVKKGGVMASSYVGGLSGAFIPVSEDQGMINAVNAGALTIEKLEAMTCVCSVGLDMIAIPGDTADTTIAGIIADEAAIGMINQKTTAVRVIPVIGKKVGETASFGGLLGYAPIMPVNTFSCADFVNRTGRIPAPVHSFKN